jgi:pentapeptide repeat protein
MVKRRTKRVAWMLAAILAVALLGGSGLLFLQLWPYNRFGPYCYWIARHRGTNALLMDARLRFASLPGAELQGAALGFADLAGADLAGAHLARAILRHTNLRGARLHQADLHGADLIAADLRGADLSGADLTRAKLFFTPADLKRVPGGPPMPDPKLAWNILKLTGARYDAHTRWPAGFDPVRHGAVRLR